MSFLRPLPVFVSVSVLFSLACGMLPDGAAPVPAPTPVVPAADAPLDLSSLPADVSVKPSTTPKTRGAPPATAADDAIPGRYVVKLRQGLHGKAKVGGDGRLASGSGKLDEALGRAGMKKARGLHSKGKRGGSGLFAVDADVDEAAFQSLMAQEDVEWVEPVRRYKVTNYTDPYYKYQWNMAELSLESVHSRAQGIGVIVAVVDSGVTPGADGPGNLVAGWDFFDDDADTTDSAAPTQSPSDSHGTHVAGTIAQVSNNGVGVAGVAPGALIMPIRVGDYEGVSSDLIAEGVEWAVDHGAQVINISIGGDSPSRVVEDAMRYAYDHGVVVVAASGNNGYDGKVSYPAAYPTVIAVGAHDGAQRETSYSNHGAELAILAPGGDTTKDLNRDGMPDGILQGTITSKGWGYAMLEGTSMASPHVAGAAAILISAGVKGPDAVRSALLSGATNVGGNRVLNIVGALDVGTGIATTVAPATTAPATTAPAAAEAPATAERKRPGREGGAAGTRAAPTREGGGGGGGGAKGEKAGKAGKKQRN